MLSDVLERDLKNCQKSVIISKKFTKRCSSFFNTKNQKHENNKFSKKSASFPHPCPAFLRDRLCYRVWILPYESEQIRGVK